MTEITARLSTALADRYKDMPEAATQALAAVTILAILGIMVKIATRPAVA